MSTPVKSDSGEVNADGKPIPQPTLSEAYFMLNIIKFIKGKLDTDWDLVAEAQGLKNAETAKVRFGQIKKKLGFAGAGATPRARATPKKRAAPAADGDDEGGAAPPAEKKPRARAPAKPRGKKAQAAAAAAAAGSSVPPSSPTTIVAQSSPLAPKSVAKEGDAAYMGPIPSGLNDGNSYALSGAALSAANSTGNGYLATPAPPRKPVKKSTNNIGPKTETDVKTPIKPEPEDYSSSDVDDEDEDAANSRAKARLFSEINEQQIRPERGASEHPVQSPPPYHQYQQSQPQAQVTADMRHTLASGPTLSSFGPPNYHFPGAGNLTAAQVQATAGRNNQGQPRLDSRSPMVPHHGGGNVTTIAHQGGGSQSSALGSRAGSYAGSHAGSGRSSQQTSQQAADVDEDMTAGADQLPSGGNQDVDEDFNAFTAAMYGAVADRGAGGGLFGWPSF